MVSRAVVSLSNETLPFVLLLVSVTLSALGCVSISAFQLNESSSSVLPPFSFARCQAPLRAVADKLQTSRNTIHSYFSAAGVKINPSSVLFACISPMLTL